LTVGLTGSISKVYDATTSAVLSSANYALTGSIGGDSVTLNNPSSGTYDTKNVGTGKTVLVSGLSISGASAANYVLASTTVSGTVGVITQAPLTVTGLSAQNKIYDGTVTVQLMTAGATLSGVLGSDNVTLNGSSTGTFTDKNVGNNKAVSVAAVTLGGTDGANYSLTQPAGLTANITAATLTAGLTGTVSKTYNGTTAATLAAANYTLTGTLGTDTVALNNPTTGSYDTKNVGAGKTVSITGLSISGADSGNYVLASTNASGTVGIITPATLTASLIGTVSKTYDGGVSATLGAANYTLTGVLGFDAVALNNPTSGSYDSKNAGTGKSVSVAGLALGGAGAGDYVLAASTAVANIGTITPKPLTYVVADASSTFGTAPILGAATLTGLAAGDAVTGTVGIFDAASAMVAANANTPVASYVEKVVSLTGSGAANYAIATSGDTNGTLTVNAAVITPSQISSPTVTPVVTVTQASQVLSAGGAVSFVTSTGKAATAIVTTAPSGQQSLSVTTSVGGASVTYSLAVNNGTVNGGTSSGGTSVSSSGSTGGGTGGAGTGSTGGGSSSGNSGSTSGGGGTGGDSTTGTAGGGGGSGTGTTGGGAGPGGTGNAGTGGGSSSGNGGETGGNGAGGGELLGSYSSFDDLLAAAEATQTASN